MGLPHEILRLAEEGHLQVCATLPILDEVRRVLAYPKLTSRLEALRLDVAGVLAYVMEQAVVAGSARDPAWPAIVAVDPSDDVFLHAATDGGAACVVSGDRHLLDLGRHQGIPILTARDFLARYFPERLR